jgi:hypothetical protein
MRSLRCIWRRADVDQANETSSKELSNRSNRTSWKQRYNGEAPPTCTRFEGFYLNQNLAVLRLTAKLTVGNNVNSPIRTSAIGLLQYLQLLYLPSKPDIHEQNTTSYLTLLLHAVSPCDTNTDQWLTSQLSIEQLGSTKEISLQK